MITDSPKCPTCGYVMCQTFDDVPVTKLATLAVPNGRYICYHCTSAESRHVADSPSRVPSTSGTD